MKNEIKKLKKTFKKIEKQISCIGPVMRGSIVLLKNNCANKNCMCHKDKTAKHPAYYFSVKMNKKTKLIYLGKKKLNIAKEYNDN